jgi:internalin A
MSTKTALIPGRETNPPRVSAILLAFILSLAGLPAKAQVVNFPDPNLEQAVRDALNIPSGPITQSNMLTLTNLYAASLGITNLIGLNTASNLLALDVSFNQLTNMSPVAGLTKLTQLHGGWNPVQDCSPLAGLTNLTWLDFNSAQLTNIAPLAGLRHLGQLVVPWNHVLDATPVGSLTNLFWLDIGGNRGALDSSITNIAALTGLKQLQWLSLYYLRVSDLSSLAGLTTLTNLDVGWNPAPTNFAALNGLTNLVLLHLNNDNVSNIVFTSHLPLLQDLDIGNNNVSDLSPAVGRNIIWLQAYNNTTLTNASVVTNFHQLAHLSLGTDGLTNITFLSGMTNLQELWVNSNPNLRSITPILSLTNLWHLDVDNDAFTNLAAVAVMNGLTWLEMNGIATPQNISFLGQMTNLTSLDAGNDQVGSLAPLTPLTQMQNLYLNTDVLTDIGPLLSFPNLGYVDVRGNLLDTNAAAAAWNVITNLQNNFVDVDYNPQNISPTLTIWDSPAEQCVSTGAMTYFAVSASSTAGPVTYQWQFNGSDIAGQTNDVLSLTGVSSNQAGLYRAVVFDNNGAAASDAAQLYVGDPNCGRTLTIQQQPVNTCAAPGEDVTFNVVATTTLTNLYYQWLFDGTNISGGNVSGDTTDTLMLSSVDTNQAGIYQVLVWDDSSNVVASTEVELMVVDLVSFTDPNLSNQVVQALGFAPGTPVHLTDLDDLNYFYIGSQNITNLSGLECARNLYGLDLGGNQISDPSPLGWLITLQYLYLDNCGLQDASFVSGLTNLIQLSLNYNQIHSIPEMQGLVANLDWLEINYNGPLVNFPRLACLTNMVHLALHDDGLPDIDFTVGMGMLQLLDAGGDGVGDPNGSFVSDMSPLTNKTALNWLSLAFDQVTNVPIVAAFSNLNVLYLSSNYFGNVSFLTNMPDLNVLAVNLSQVTNLAPLVGHASLTYLDVSSIATTNLSFVSGLTGLNTLWAGGNNVGGASPVSALTHLQVLGYNDNGVSDLSPLGGLTNLYYLDLENNQVTNVSLLSGRTNLSSLYLTGNQVHDLTPLSGLTNVQWLSLDANGFTNIAPLGNLRALVWLMMQSNHIQDVTSLAGLTNLNYGLDLSANQITNLAPATNLHALTWLGTWQNNLVSLPSLVGLSNVTYLDFSFNQLTNISGASGLAQVNWLSFDNNQLVSVTSLTNIPQLATLDFANNQLTNLSGLANLPKLQWLGLRSNKFVVAPTIVGLPSLQTIDLTSNLLTDVSGLAGETSLNWLYLSYNQLQDIHSLTNLTALYYTDLRYNLLDTGSPAVTTPIAVMESQGAYVDYLPQLTVAPFLLLSPVRLGAHQFQFTIQSPSGSIVQIWTSTNLATTNWRSAGFVTNSTGATNFMDTGASNATRFYRGQQM